MNLSDVTLGTSIASIEAVNDDCAYRVIEADSGSSSGTDRLYRTESSRRRPSYHPYEL